jgi:hypothetical protein
MGELGAWGSKLAKMLDPASMGRIEHAVGMAAKKKTGEAAQRSLGSDSAMSNLKGGKAPLRSGFDTDGSSVSVKFTGPWRLAESGRKASGPIYPKKGKGKGKGVLVGRAVLTPKGPRASSRYGPSKGLNTLSDASDAIEGVAGKTAFKQLQSEIGRIIN